MDSLLGLIVLVLDIAAIIDIVQGSMDNTRKVIWALVVLIFPVIGMVVYFLIGRKTPLIKS